MALQRIDRMNEPPIVGRYYLVPCVTAKWNDVLDDWPVIGPEHDDIPFFAFKHRHYHFDARFLTYRQRCAITWPDKHNDPDRLARQCMGSPLQTNDLGCNPGGLPKPVLMRKRCAIGSIWAGSDITGSATWKQLEAHYAGQQCASGKRGWVCPHQNVALGSVAPIDGVIHCPLHGLRIDAETGVCLGV